MGDSNDKDDNLSLPKATVTKLIKDILPEDIKCSNETRDLILECCVEFIHLISSEANDICNKDSKSTIAAEHILKALDDLGFNEYTAKVTDAYDKHKIEASSKPSRAQRKNETPTKSKEQLLMEQQLLFAQAKTAYNLNNSGSGIPTAAVPISNPPDATALPPPPPPQQ